MLGVFSVFAGNKTEKIEEKAIVVCVKNASKKLLWLLTEFQKPTEIKRSKKMKLVFDDAKADLNKIEIAK